MAVAGLFLGFMFVAITCGMLPVTYVDIAFIILVYLSGIVTGIGTCR